MNQWHYSKNGKQFGPIDIEQLKVMIVAGELSWDSLVWQVGTKEWIEVGSCAELIEQIQSPPPLPKSVAIASGSRRALTSVVDAIPALTIALFVVGLLVAYLIHLSDNNTALIAIAVIAGVGLTAWMVIALRPKHDALAPSVAWRRFSAKAIDLQIAFLVGIIALVLVMPTSSQIRALIFLGTSLFVWFMFEVPMKCKSLGRYLFGVTLSPLDKNEEVPNYSARFFELAFKGLGLVCPVITNVTTALAYKRLREIGVTSWDEEKFKVEIDASGTVKLILGIVLLMLIAPLQSLFVNLIEMQHSTKTATEERIQETDSLANKAKTLSNDTSNQSNGPSIYNQLTKKFIFYSPVWTLENKTALVKSIVRSNMDLSLNFKSQEDGEVLIIHLTDSAPITLPEKILEQEKVVIKIIGKQEVINANGYVIKVAEYERKKNNDYLLRVVVENNLEKGYWNILSSKSQQGAMSKRQCELTMLLIWNIDSKLDEVSPLKRFCSNT